MTKKILAVLALFAILGAVFELAFYMRSRPPLEERTMQMVREGRYEFASDAVLLCASLEKEFKLECYRVLQKEHSSPLLCRPFSLETRKGDEASNYSESDFSLCMQAFEESAQQEQ